MDRLSRRRLFGALLAVPAAAVAAVKQARADEFLNEIHNRLAAKEGLTRAEYDLKYELLWIYRRVQVEMSWQICELTNCRPGPVLYRHTFRKMEEIGTEMLRQMAADGKIRGGMVAWNENWMRGEDNFKNPEFAVRIDHNNGKSYGSQFRYYLPS